MPNPYAFCIRRWENWLAARDTNRVVRPFEWGLEWLDLLPNGEPWSTVVQRTSNWLADSSRFFAGQKPANYTLHSGHLTFSSPLPTPYPENNLVHADWFPVADQHSRAIVVLPQWNADAQGHVGLCRLLNRFGIPALRMTMPYHDRRMPAGLSRADYHVSSNIGRTIHACRQAVIDLRACLDWLEDQGYTRLGVLGTSLGSCIAFIALAHDVRVRLGIFNHASMYFGDVVWTGLSTRHVRKGIEGRLEQEQLREVWKVISPASYVDRVAGRDLGALILWGCYDTTFLPCFTRQIIEGLRSRGVSLTARMLHCGHYTIGQFPFNLIDGFTMCRFAAKNL